MIGNGTAMTAASRAFTAAELFARILRVLPRQSCSRRKKSRAIRCARNSAPTQG